VAIINNPAEMHTWVCIFRTVKFHGLKKSNLGLKTQAGLSKINVPLVINELLNETSSSSEDESFLNVLFITITNAESGKKRITKIVNFESTVVASCDNQQFRKGFRMNRSSMQFIAFEFLNSED
jgi:hypothetical protein